MPINTHLTYPDFEDNLPFYTSLSRSRMIQTYKLHQLPTKTLPTHPSNYSQQPKPIHTDPRIVSTTEAHQDLPTHPYTYSHQPKLIQTDPRIIGTTTANHCQPRPTNSPIYLSTPAWADLAGCYFPRGHTGIARRKSLNLTGNIDQTSF
jgi:hypothetical protein